MIFPVFMGAMGAMDEYGSDSDFWMIFPHIHGCYKMGKVYHENLSDFSYIHGCYLKIKS